MTPRFARACIALLTLVLVAYAPNARAQIKLGPRLTIDAGDIEALAIGAELRAPFGNVPVQFNGSFDFYLDDDIDVFAIDGNVVYLFDVRNTTFTPYAGGGLGIANVSLDNGNGDGETEVGLNLVGGAEFKASRFTPFVQFQATVGSDLDRFGITGGLLFNI
jgi:hypothetical protein